MAKSVTIKVPAWTHVDPKFNWKGQSFTNVFWIGTPYVLLRWKSMRTLPNTIPREWFLKNIGENIIKKKMSTRRNLVIYNQFLCNYVRLNVAWEVIINCLCNYFSNWDDSPFSLQLSCDYDLFHLSNGLINNIIFVFFTILHHKLNISWFSNGNCANFVCFMY